MPIHCIFHTPGQQHFCQVLAARQAKPVSTATCRLVQKRYCACGSFLSCPIFQRVEHGLVEFHKRRELMAVA